MQPSTFKLPNSSGKSIPMNFLSYTDLIIDIKHPSKNLFGYGSLGRVAELLNHGLAR